MDLRQIMREGFLFAVRKNATVAEAVRTMTEKHVGIVVVLEGDRLVGVFSERDVVRKVVDKGVDARQTTVAEVMTTEIVIATENEDEQTAMRRMDSAGIRHLPILRGRQVVSMLSIRDLMRVGMTAGDDRPLRLHDYLEALPPA